LGRDGVTQFQTLGQEPKLATPLTKEEEITLAKVNKEGLDEKKGDYLETFIENLPTKKHYVDQRKAAWNSIELKKDKEQALMSAAQKKWKINSLRKMLNKQVKDYNKIQSQIKPLIGKIASKEKNQIVTTVLGILAEAQPQKFVVTTSLLDSLKDSFKRLSQLGEAPEEIVAMEPKKETDLLLKQTAAEAEVTLRELEAKQHKLECVKAKVEGRKPPPPAPPPISITKIEIYLKQQEAMKPSPKQETIKLLNKLLPIVAVLLILSKLLG